MKLVLEGHDRLYDLQAIAGAFFPARGFDEDGLFVHSALTADGGGVNCQTEIYDAAARSSGVFFEPGDTPDSRRSAVKRSFYEAAVAFTGAPLPWGVFTGIRPVKQLEAEFCGNTAAFARHYLIAPEKEALCSAVAAARGVMGVGPTPREVCLYVSIPFCPSRCSYCSFISQAGEKMLGMIPDYLDALCREITLTGALVRECGLKVRAAYIGGGTPAVLDAGQISRLMAHIADSVDLSECGEFTFEAGRPDVITCEKLAAARAGGADRVCVNTQTLSDKVLADIGRRHTAAQYFEACDAAARAGFEHINTDLIIGLPGETEESFARSLDGVLGAGVDSVTVHALCIKHSSGLRADRSGAGDGARASAMSRLAFARLTGAGQAPYYIYKQKDAVGALENVGYARRGAESVYNCVMMDDMGTVLAAGANASSKITGGRVPVRFYGHKYPYEYLSDSERSAAQKKEICALLQNIH